MFPLQVGIFFMTKQERYSFFINYFLTQAPDAETELVYNDAFQLLVAVILSAQCTDKRVNMVTPNIFKRFPNVKSMASADFEELFPLIKSISYPNNKAKHLIGTAKMLLRDFNSEVPMTVDELILLPGVGRKTANVITSVIDNQPNMAVDTHVFRVSTRIGLITNAKKQLTKHIPAPYVHIAHHWLILHGRYICTARKPHCGECGLISICKFVNK